MFKRVSAFAVTIAMLLSMVCMFSFASADNEMALSISAPETADKDDTITVTVGLENYIPIAGLELEGTYDADKLVFDELTPVFPIGEENAYVEYNVKDGKINFVIADHGNVEVEDEAILFEMTFTVAEDADFGDVATLELKLTDVGVWNPDADNDTFGSTGAVEDLEADKYVAEATAEIEIACDHDDGDAWSDWEHVADTETHKRTCDICGEEETEDCEFEDVITKPDHFNGGYTTPTCTTCGFEKDKKDLTDPEPHKFVYTPAEANDGTRANAKHVITCEDDDGYKEEKACTFDAGVETEPTCTEDGFITYTCNDCEYKVVEASGKTAAGHKYVHDDDTEGADSTHTCEVCKDTKPCEFDKGVEYDATCTEAGGTTYTCEVCDYSYDEADEENKPATGHTWVHDDDSDPSTHSCANCDVDPVECDLVLDEDSYVEGDCVTNGYAKYVCADCGYYTEEETVASGVHNGKVIHYKAATATAEGAWYIRCDDCEQVLGTTVIPKGHPFTDMKDASYWGYPYAMYGKAYHLFKNDAFKGDANITRAEFVTTLCRTMLEGYLTEDEIVAKYTANNSIGDDFTDVAGQWYAPYARYMKELGVVGGSYGKFNGNSYITREEVAAMVHRLVKQVDPDEKLVFIEKPIDKFTDMDAVASWFKDDVEWARKSGLFAGNAQKQMEPKKNNSRLQMAIVLMRFTEAYYEIVND